MEQLTSQLKEKADWCSELLLSTEQRCRELQERDEEIDKLESRVRELEQALLASAESLEKVRMGRAGGRADGRTEIAEGDGGKAEDVRPRECVPLSVSVHEVVAAEAAGRGWGLWRGRTMCGCVYISSTGGLLAVMDTEQQLTAARIDSQGADGEILCDERQKCCNKCKQRKKWAPCEQIVSFVCRAG